MSKADLPTEERRADRTDPPIPTVGMYRTEDHQYFWNGVGPLPSVTTVMKMYDKSDALVGWAKKETSSFAIRHLDELIAHRTHNTPEPFCPPCDANVKRRKPVERSEAARLWVSSISDYKRDSAASLGTRVHAAAEKMARGEEPDLAPDEIPYAEQYQHFLADHQPEFFAIEYMGINRTHGYAGTGDIIARTFTGHHAAIDIKTFTKPGPVPKTYYPETAMQLAACSRFDFIGLEGDPVEYPVPFIDSHAVLLIGSEDYRVIPYRVTDATFDAFLACLSLYRWKYGEATTIVGAA